MARQRRHLLAIILVLVGVLAASAATQALAGSDDRTTFSGQATVVKASVLGVDTTLADTGPIPASGDARETSLLTANVPGLLTAQVLHANVVAQGKESDAEASVANVNLTVAGNSIAADFLASRASAACTASGPTTIGSSEIAGLTINGQAITITGEPNQRVNLPGGAYVAINEQTSSRPGDVTVNALHVVVPGVADVVISSAHADVTCKPACNEQVGDFVTGGGWITGTPTGARGNFAVAGGLKNGALWGHLQFIDHSGSPKVKGTGVTAYSGTGNTRHIEGTAEVNGQSGFTYKVDVTDNGEPGRDDSFSLELSSGYSASGKLAGGNIQLHVPKSPCQ